MRILSYLRNRVEGLAFSLDPIGHNCPEKWCELKRREGLAFFRKGWWLHTRYESYATCVRYARLLDWALGEPGFRPPGNVLPKNGRLVVFRLGHLGDMLHLLPVIDSIKNQRPDLRLELLTGPWNAPLASQYAAFDAVHYFAPDVEQFHRGDRRGVMPTRKEREWIRRIRGTGVDTVFAPSVPHFCELAVMIGLKPSCYVGCEWPIADVPVQGEKRFRTFESRRYELDAVADFLPCLGLSREPLRLRFRVAEPSSARVSDLLKEAGLAGRRFMVAFPGAGWRGKCWPCDRFSAALDAIARETGTAIVLGGSAGERALCEKVRSSMKQPALNTAGLLALDESAALIERAEVVLCNDSAPMHIAAALDRPTVSLWGPTFPEKWAPRGAQHRVIRAEGQCSGCVYWHPRARCMGQPPCMQTIKIETVVQAILSVLSASQPPIENRPTRYKE